MELKRYWEILIRRKWLFAAVFSSIAIVALLFSNWLPPSYEAAAKISIETSSVLSTLLNELGVDTERTSAVPTGTQKYELMSDDLAKVTVRPLLQELIAGLQLRDRHSDLIEPDELIRPSIKKLLLPEPFIKVEQYEDSCILEIAAISAYPEEALMMANTLANLYIDEQIRQRRQECERVRLFIQSKIGGARAEYFNALKEFMEFGVNEGVVDLDVQIEKAIDRLTELSSSYEESMLLVSEARASIKAMKASLSEIQKVRFSSAKIENNELLQSLKSKLHGYEIEMAGLGTEFQPEHPDIIRIKSEVEHTKQLIKEEAEKSFSSETTEVDPLYDEVAGKLAAAYVAALSNEARRDALKGMMEKHERKLMGYPAKSMRRGKLQSYLGVSEGIYQKLLGYLGRVAIAESITLSEVRLIDPATKPDLLDPYFPKKTATALLGIFMGIFWGLIGVFFLEYLDDKIHTRGDLERVTSLVLLGSIPRKKRLDKFIISGFDPDSAMVEHFREIRNNIKQLYGGNSPTTLLIASPNKGDGRTAATVNLGISISNEGKRALLIDLDLRNPAIHKRVGFDSNEGIVDYLEKDIPIEVMVKKTNVENLSAIFCGTRPIDPGRLIDSPRLKEIIRKLAAQYETVIIDSPHFISISDAFVLSNYADAVVLVVKAGKTTVRLLKRIDQGLIFPKAKIAGMILIK